MAYCSYCGHQTQPQAVVCLRCGAAVQRNFAASPDPAVSPHDWLATALLCFFLGAFGIHRFYTGHRTVGIFQLLTAGGCGIWWLFDLLVIVLGNFRDSEGRLVTR